LLYTLLLQMKNICKREQRDRQTDSIMTSQLFVQVIRENRKIML
jgi:hypothetical protein